MKLIKYVIASFLLLSFFLPVTYAQVNGMPEKEVPGSGLMEKPSPSGEGLDMIVPELQPLIDTIKPLVLKVSIIVGGIFGLYIILILIRIHYERKKVKILKDIRYDLDQLNKHHEIGYSQQKKGLLRRMVNYLGGHRGKEEALGKNKKKL